MLLLEIYILISNRQVRLLDINIPALGRARTAEFGLEQNKPIKRGGDLGLRAKTR